MAGPGTTIDQPAIGRKAKAKGPRTKKQLRKARNELKLIQEAEKRYEKRMDSKLERVIENGR